MHPSTMHLRTGNYGGQGPSLQCNTGRHGTPRLRARRGGGWGGAQGRARRGRRRNALDLQTLSVLCVRVVCPIVKILARGASAATCGGSRARCRVERLIQVYVVCLCCKSRLYLRLCNASSSRNSSCPNLKRCSTTLLRAPRTLVRSLKEMASRPTRTSTRLLKKVARV